MLMQPSPRAETSRLLFPSVRFFMMLSFQLLLGMTCHTRHELDCRCARRRSHHRIDIPTTGAAVFDPIGGIDLVVDARVDFFLKGHFLAHVASTDAAPLVPYRHPTPTGSG